MHSWIWWRRLAGLLAVALLLIACGGQPSSDGGSQGNAEDDVIRVGVVTSLTGPNAATGRQVAVGVQQAAAEWNERGGINGRRIEVVVEDDAGSPTGAVTAYNKLISQARPAAIWLPTLAPLVMAVEPAVREAKIPTFTSATATVITTTGDGWFFRLRTNDEKQGRLVAAYALEELKSANPAILYPSNDYGRGGYEAIKTTLDEAGVPLVAAETFNQGDKDVSTQLRKIKAAGADLLIAWTIPTDSAMVAVQAKQVGLAIPILGSPGFGTPEYLALAQEATDSIHVVLDGAVGWDEQSQPFVERVQQRFPDTPVSFVVSSNYDGAMMLFAAMEKVGTDPEALREALLATQDYQGVTGLYAFDEAGNGLHQGVLARWEGQKLVPIRTMNLKD